MAFRRQHHTFALYLAAGSLVPLAVPCWAASVSFVDDRGEAVEAPLRVCFVRDLGTDCHEVEPEPPAGVSVPLQPFDLLRVEGPEHGPATAEPGELEELEGGERRLAVPRKARLRVTGLPEEAVTLSLYRADDPQARQPRFRRKLSASDAAAELYVPAGAHLASLHRRGGAPDLHALSAPPGAERTLRYRERAGWSLAVRTLAPEDEADPVEGARVRLTPPPTPNGAPGATGATEDAELPEARTGPLGFALFNGLESHLVHARVRHPEFVESEVLGLSATPGSFDLYHAVLDRGGIIEARVSVDGEPAAAAVCRIVEEAGMDEERNVIVETLREAPVSDGLCRLDRVAEGRRFFRVVLQEPDVTMADREVQVIDGETSYLDLELSPIRISGTIYRGDEPVGGGYRVLIDHFPPSGPGGGGDPLFSTTSDEEGEYSATLWEPSDYYFKLASPENVSITTAREDMSGPEERVDFHLPAREIRGRVVDEDGRPVEGARVGVRWTGPSNAGFTGRSSSNFGTRDDGTFALPLRYEAADVELYAMRRWAERGESVHLSIAPGEPVPPVTLVLAEDERAAGRLVTVRGEPVRGGRVWSYRAPSGGAPTFVGAAWTEPDGSFGVPRAEGAPTWIYASGPGCPLNVYPAPPPDPEGTLELRCPEGPATLRLRMLDGQGTELSGRSLILRHEGRVIPFELLADHLASLGLPAASDGRGRLVVASVAPGDYDVYLHQSANEATVAQGLRYGFVVSTTLAPAAATDLEIVVDEGR